MTCATILFRWVAICLLQLSLIPAPAADSNVTTTATNTLPEANTETIRSLLQLQETLHDTKLQIERNRQDAEAAALRNSEAIASRLQNIEQSMSNQRKQEIEVLQSSNRLIIILAGSFASVGLLSMFLAAYFQWRSVTRLAEISAALPSARLLSPAPTVHALGAGDPQLLGLNSPDQVSARLGAALEKLETRLRDLESTSRKVLSKTDGPSPETGASGQEQPSGNGTEPGEAHPTPANGFAPGKAAMLLTRAQAAIDEDELENALRILEEVLAADPQHAEALVKKGLCLERLRRLNEALACYDQALAADDSLTIAYLQKGGLYNRMERYSDALHCYEQALRTQEKKTADAGVAVGN